MPAITDHELHLVACPPQSTIPNIIHPVPHFQCRRKNRSSPIHPFYHFCMDFHQTNTWATNLLIEIYSDILKSGSEVRRALERWGVRIWGLGEYLNLSSKYSECTLLSIPSFRLDLRLL